MLNKIMSLLSTARLDLSDEKRTQVDFAAVLTDQGITFSREHRLSAADIPDFLIDGIAVELKLKGARKKAIFKQITRYAEHDAVKAIILATNVTMGLPENINGKPVYIAPLGRAWL